MPSVNPSSYIYGCDICQNACPYNQNHWKNLTVGLNRSRMFSGMTNLGKSLVLLILKSFLIILFLSEWD